MALFSPGKKFDEAAEQAAQTLARVNQSLDTFDGLIVELLGLVADAKQRGLVIRIALDHERPAPSD